MSGKLPGINVPTKKCRIKIARLLLRLLQFSLPRCQSHYSLWFSSVVITGVVHTWPTTGFVVSPTTGRVTCEQTHMATVSLVTKIEANNQASPSDFPLSSTVRVSILDGIKFPVLTRSLYLHIGLDQSILGSLYQAFWGLPSVLLYQTKK